MCVCLFKRILKSNNPPSPPHFPHVHRPPWIDQLCKCWPVLSSIPSGLRMGTDTVDRWGQCNVGLLWLGLLRANRRPQASTSYMYKLSTASVLWAFRASFKLFKGIHVHCRKFWNFGNSVRYEEKKNHYNPVIQRETLNKCFKYIHYSLHLFHYYFISKHFLSIQTTSRAENRLYVVKEVLVSQ